MLSTAAESSNSIEVTQQEKKNFELNERKGMMVFIDDPPGTVFKSVVAIVEMAVYESVILEQVSIEKVNMELVKLFVWINC